MTLRNRVDLTTEEIALAFELRQAKCCFKRIAEGLHVDPCDLSAELRARKLYGTGTGRDTTGPAFKTPLALLRSVKAMRLSRMGWDSISAHCCVPREQLRLAYNRALKRGWLE